MPVREVRPGSGGRGPPPPPPPPAAGLEPVRDQAERALRALPGVLNATVVLTAHRPTVPAADPAPAPSGGGHRPLGLGGAEPPAKLLAEVRAVVAAELGR